MATLFLNEVWLRIRSFHSHRIYLNAILGFGSGASIALLGLLSLAQVVSCAVLVLPNLYKRMGTAVPSVALGATLAVEMLLYHGFNDAELTVKAFMIEATLFMIGLLRGDARIRSNAIGTPLHGRALAIEARIREVCTRLHLRLVLPPISFIMVLRSMFCHNFWWYSGTAFEIKRTSFCTCISQCAFMSVVSGQDRSARLNITDKAIDFAYQRLRTHTILFSWARRAHMLLFRYVPGKRKHI